MESWYIKNDRHKKAAVSVEAVIEQCFCFEKPHWNIRNGKSSSGNKVTKSSGDASPVCSWTLHFTYKQVELLTVLLIPR